MIATRQRVKQPYGAARAQNDEPDLERQHTARLHAHPRPGRFAQRRPPGRVDGGALRDGDHRQRAGEQVKAVVCQPDGQAERDQRRPRAAWMAERTSRCRRPHQSAAKRRTGAPGASATEVTRATPPKRRIASALG